ncbi:hypothetical protein [uncultured Metabacillus sp.]|uniref:hypothetical protein n=1 Tax=uncultured Metabacillus sp. TaxID=2860135 RepID=UPI00262667F4|nr:hypothetical protein [uncultured Metabacillus sp.]
MWIRDTESQQQKEKEISVTVRNMVESELTEFNLLSGGKEIIFNAVFDSVTVSAPSSKEEELMMTYTQLNHSQSRLSSVANYKPGNVRFNIKQMLDSLTDSTVAIAGGLTTPEILPYVAARVIVNVFKFNPFKFELSLLDGHIINTLNLFKGTCEADDLYKQLNYQLPYTNSGKAISRNEFDESISRLQKLRIINKDGVILNLIDEIRFNYR